jgi:hypothetical protein
MKNLICIFLTIAFSLNSNLSFSQTATPKIQKEQREQKARINQGDKNGSLTEKEEARLRAGQAAIRNEKAQAKSDGVVTGSERKEIKKMQKREDKAIRRKKHNGRTQN